MPATGRALSFSALLHIVLGGACLAVSGWRQSVKKTFEKQEKAMQGRLEQYKKKLEDRKKKEPFLGSAYSHAMPD